jgi:HK97 gp10 family phage protein
MVVPDGVEIKTNLPDFLRQLREFGDDVTKKVVRAGISAAGQIFKRQVIQLAPVYQGPTRKGREAGTLRRNIIVKRLRPRDGEERQFVGVRTGRSRPRKGAPIKSALLPFYAPWVEKGHRIVARGQKIAGGRRTQALKRERFHASGGKRTRPVRFIRGGFDQGKDQALQAFGERMNARIAKENAKRTPGP